MHVEHRYAPLESRRSTRDGRPVAGSERKYQADLGREIGSLAGQSKAGIEFQNQLPPESRLGFKDGRDLVALALQRRDEAPGGGDPLQVFDAIFSQPQVAIRLVIDQRHPSAEGAPAVALDDAVPK